MNDITIEDLSRHVDFIPLLAKWHFKQWGDLTGALTESDYRARLSPNACIQKLPLTLVAIGHGGLVGSANIVAYDMDIRLELTPWLAQLYIHPPERGRGIGSALASRRQRRV